MVFTVAIIFVSFLSTLSCANASELIACKSDTYISQADKNKEFSKSKTIKISNTENAKTIAYLPFYIDTNDIGYQPTRDTIIHSVLSLRFKLRLDENEKKVEPALEQTNKQKNIDKSDVNKKTEDKETSNIYKKVENQNFEKKCQLHFYAITDAETFVPNSEESKVSWDGKNTSSAPKHNNIDDELADDGLLSLGEMTIDFEKSKLNDGDEIEFLSDKLAEFLNFAFGSINAQQGHCSFRSQLEKIERICIIIKQTSGSIPLHIYSSDSLEDENIQKQTKKSEAVNETKTSSENIDEYEKPAKETPDFRPRIIFEFRGI